MLARLMEIILVLLDVLAGRLFEGLITFFQELFANTRDKFISTTTWVWTWDQITLIFWVRCKEVETFWSNRETIKEAVQEQLENSLHIVLGIGWITLFYLLRLALAPPFFQQFSFFYGFLCYPVGLLIRLCHEAKRILLFLFSRPGLDQFVFYHHCLLCEHLSGFHGSLPLTVSSSDHGRPDCGLCFRFHSVFMKKTEEGSPEEQNTALKYPRSSQPNHYQMTWLIQLKIY